MLTHTVSEHPKQVNRNSNHCRGPQEAQGQLMYPLLIEVLQEAYASLVEEIFISKELAGAQAKIENLDHNPQV